MFCLLFEHFDCTNNFTDTVYTTSGYYSDMPDYNNWFVNSNCTISGTTICSWNDCPDNLKYTFYIHALEDETNLLVNGSPAQHYVEWFVHNSNPYYFIVINHWGGNSSNGGFNPNGSDSGYVAIENLCIPDGIHYPELFDWPSSSYYTLINHYGDTVAFGNYEADYNPGYPFDVDTIVLGIQGCTEPTAQNFDPNATFSLQNNNQPYDCLGCNYNFSINYDSLLGCCPTEIYNSNGIEYNDYTLDTFIFALMLQVQYKLR